VKWLEFFINYMIHLISYIVDEKNFRLQEEIWNSKLSNTS